MKVKKVSVVWLSLMLFLIKVPAEKTVDKLTTETLTVSGVTVEDLYPGLSSGILMFAQPAELSGEMILRAGNVTISSAEIKQRIEEAPAQLQAELNKNAFFILENIAVEKLLLQIAQQYAAANKIDVKSKSDPEIINEFLEKTIKVSEVTDAEVSEFYEANKDQFGNINFERIKRQLKEHIRQQKQQSALKEYICNIGKTMRIEISASWLKKYAALALDNPVDRARASGKPTMVDFGAHGCRPCDMMTPILETLKQKYTGKANIIFVNVREAQILGARYGIQTIPVQVFFDKDGKEVYRHIGFFDQDKIEQKLSELGVK